MITNYYCTFPEGDRLHIGKSSPGWTFAVRIYPTEPSTGMGTGPITSLEDWERVWEREGVGIVDEYGRAVTKTEMLDVITKRSQPNHTSALDWRKWLRANGALPGPNNLAVPQQASRPDPDCTYHYVSHEFF